jgi:SAM-dependent methyltransferase
MTTAALPFTLPAPFDATATPEWTGRGFLVGGQIHPVLAYGGDGSGWTDELTRFPEDAAGESHFIDNLSRAHAIGELRQLAGKGGLTLMDIGCSSGFLLRDLVKEFPRATILGSDYVGGPLYRLAEQLPAVPLLQFDLKTCPLPDQSLDGVTALNVLEHIDDDRLAAAQIHRILRPGGLAVIEVPAGPGLYDYYDAELQHFRRYTMKSITAVLRGAGFTILKRRHLGVSIYPPFWLVKKWHRAFPPRPSAQRERLKMAVASTRSLTPVVGQVLKLEQALLKHIPVPFGIRCVITARK